MDYKTHYRSINTEPKENLTIFLQHRLPMKTMCVTLMVIYLPNLTNCKNTMKVKQDQFTKQKPLLIERKSKIKNNFLSYLLCSI